MSDKPINSKFNDEVVKDENGIEYRRSLSHLPAYYRTDANHKFLSSTLDPLIQPGELTRLDGYIGSRTTYTRLPDDKYIDSSTIDRTNYQLEPTVTYFNKDTSSINPEDQIEFSATYDDFINQISYFGGVTSNHNRLTSEDVYSWNPAIDFDKLINYREYYWLPEGPNSILVEAVGPGAVVDIDVTSSGASSYLFSTYSNTPNPSVTLFRGNTYRFKINAVGHPFYIMTEPFKTGVAEDGSTSILFNTGVENNGTASGTVTFTVPDDCPDTLYYQCGTHSEMQGVLSINTVSADTLIDVDTAIAGAVNYTTSKGVQLTNGMKIRFGENVTNQTEFGYVNKEYYVEGVGSAITLTDTAELIPTGSYSKEVSEFYDEVPYASRPYATSFFRAEDPDYITIKRDSVDGNAWSRYNRWFHRATIEATAKALGYTPELLETDRAKRPIIEFDAGIALYNHGTLSKKSVALVDTVTGDAFTNMVNKTGYIIDGVPVREGMRILLTADTDPLVNNKIYVIKFVEVLGREVTTLELAEDSDTNPVHGECVHAEFGKNNQGKIFFFDSVTNSWKTGQNKTKLQQAPLFDVFDNNHSSFGDTRVYPNSTFKGTELFSYKLSDNAVVDTVLDLPVKYKTINNVGDMLFESDFASGSFTYSVNNQTQTVQINSGHLHRQADRNTIVEQTTWLKRNETSKQYVVEAFDVTENEQQLFPVTCFENSVELTDLEISVEVDSVTQDLDIDYTLVNGTTNRYVKFVNPLEVGSTVTLYCYSNAKKTPGVGFYDVPEALEINPLNAELSEFTYGQVLKHLQDITRKNTTEVGKVPGNTNLRDLPDIRFKGGTILQHSASMPAATFCLIDKHANFIESLYYNSLEYQKFKENFIQANTDISYNDDPVDAVDLILKSLSASKDSSFPYFYEDMVGHGENFTTRTYTVQDSSITFYAIDTVFDLQTLSSAAVYVYLNGEQLLHGYDYQFSNIDESVEILTALSAGDTVEIRQYTATQGSFVPITPSKVGLYPKYKPELVVDNTYSTPTTFIVGHDGSRTKAYGDYRDNIILELEKRIYNNIKVDYNSSLFPIWEVLPSSFSDNQYSHEEIVKIQSIDFYAWAGRNNIDYQTNDVFERSNQFTWNYSAIKSPLSSGNLPGSWRGIYRCFYDTERPHVTPWEMLGYTEMPDWWIDLYGPAPYTAGNEVMWQDLERGFDYGRTSVNPRFIRSGLSNYLPVDDNGNLKTPVEIGIVEAVENKDIARPWKFGDVSPAESAWRNSSQYPFSVVRTLALAKPAKFFGRFLDSSALIETEAGKLVDKTTMLTQKLHSVNYHLELDSSTTNGDAVRLQTTGYQPFIVNYLISQGLDPASFFYDKMKNLQVQLGYKLGGFTDKSNIRIQTDSVSPGSSAGTQTIPSENYKILFRTSNPVKIYNYSGVLIELVSSVPGNTTVYNSGYRVYGYNQLNPYFTVFTPRKNSRGYEIKTANGRAVIYNDWTSTAVTVSYGTVFTDVQQVVDFLVGYGRYLESEGFVFDHYSGELGEVLNWELSAREFLYWTRQGWTAGSALTVSPGAAGFSLTTKNSVVGSIRNIRGEYTVLGADGQKLPLSEVSTKRLGNTFEITSKSADVGIYHAQFTTVQKEHIILFDNTTVFSDIIYEQSTGYRQERLKIIGWKTGNWNGDYYAPGFVFDKAEVNLWTANTDYNIGDTVEYNAGFYVASANHNSGSAFDAELWQKKNSKPASQLIPSFDYKISQFNDFYNLESNNFDEGQQRLAQHLIGYQSRPYLENLFSNDIAQYKFYQGYIRDKGTENAINRLLKARFNNDEIDIELRPEWMIKVGEFGNLDSDQSVQIKMPEATFTNNRQSIEMLDTTADRAEWIKSAAVVREDLYSAPVEYTASTTFDLYDYSNGVDHKEHIIKYKTAGFPRLSDVQHTAFNEADILNLDVEQIGTHDQIWVAKKTNNDWDVYRLTFADLRIVSLRALENNTQLEASFNTAHNFSVNQYFAIKSSQFLNLDGVYAVKAVPSNSQIVFDFEKANTVSSSALFVDDSTVNTFGNIYRFISTRVETMDTVNELLEFDQYDKANPALEIPGDKVFANNPDGLWRIYEKIDPYTLKILESPSTEPSQSFGHQIVGRQDGKVVVVSAPTLSQGTVNFFSRKEKFGEFGLISSNTTIDDYEVGSDTKSADLGFSLSISTDDNFVVAGAPHLNVLTERSEAHADSGQVKIYQWNDFLKVYQEKYELDADDGSTDLTGYNFGWDHACGEMPALPDTGEETPKYLMVSAPGYNNDEGIVYMYSWKHDGSTEGWTLINSIESPDPEPGKRFGHQVQINSNADILAVSSKSPNNAGCVEIFTRQGTSWNCVQTLVGVTSDGSSLNTAFGECIDMSKSGDVLVASAPGYDDDLIKDTGAIYEFKWNHDGSTTSYTLVNTIVSPAGVSNVRFGSSLSLNRDGNRLLIGAEQFANKRPLVFDYDATTFDLGDTTVVDLNKDSGTVFTATRYNDLLVIDDRLVTSYVGENDDFGRGLCAVNNTVYVGAPRDDSPVGDGSTFISNDGTVAVFDTTEDDVYSWKPAVEETPLVDNRKILSSFIFNRASNTIIDYCDYYDPIKGRILGVADKEIDFKTEWDPAVYNVGTSVVSVNEKTAWGKEHVGQVWWDLSTVRWLWYEQGSQEYKTVNWGKMFPGSTVDVYEWVESKYLPSQWYARANAGSGRLERISGQPKYVDDTALTVSQTYNRLKDGFENRYYFWVKNTVYLPSPESSTVPRSNTTSYIANLIANPIGSGIKHFAVTAQNSVVMFNTKNSLENDNVVANITYTNNLNDGDIHSVWKFVKEGDKNDKPSSRIESKWWDSLVGTDIAGNEVPDLNLPINDRYGNKIRPRQSWYVNRLEALKEIVQYSNSVIVKEQLANQISYNNLNDEEIPPGAASGLWESSVDTYAELTYINTADIDGTTNVLVLSDEENSNNLWAIYNWNGSEWTRTRVQTHNTGRFYYFVDWYRSDVDADLIIDKQVDYEYQLDTLDVAVGTNTKVRYSDVGGWKIYQRTLSGWDNVATQNGTIQLSASLYDYSIKSTGFAGEDAFDQNSFDEEPVIETRKILQALRDDIFVGNLAGEYNNIFFIGLRKVFEEQPYVDWLVKTSMFSVYNKLRPLDQRKTYETSTQEYVEDYINEVKPYHAKVKEYKLGYVGQDTQDGIFTDFDLPAVYDNELQQIRNVDPNTDLALMDSYPYKFWIDNYAYSVKEFVVSYGGSGYVTPPEITVLGGTVQSTGPYTILSTSTAGSTSGLYGYYYPLYTSLANSNHGDVVAGGSGESVEYRFADYPGQVFYSPVTNTQSAQVNKPQQYSLYASKNSGHATATAVVREGKLVKVRLVSAGSGYTATPTVLVTGGGRDGNTPADTARVYAVLENNLVRSFDTSIKFDRISSTADVKTWEQNTVYAENDLIRYSDAFYKVLTSYTSTDKFREGLTNLQELTGNESGLSAAERTLGLYAPQAGMLGNELSQVMHGVDYGGVMVTGVAFDNSRGWDRARWYDSPWDGYGSGRVIKYYGDGSTAAYTFSTAPKVTDVYTVYFTDISNIGDKSVESVANVERVRQTSQVIRGDGSTVTFEILGDNGQAPGADVYVELIPFDEDGVLTPTDDKTLDSVITGGLFKSALGVSANDVLFEGDGFVTEDTSHAPEENVPGSIFDSLDIKVYTAPESGVPFIVQKNYHGNGETSTYAIGQLPGTQASVIVTVNSAVKVLGTDYTVDTYNKTVNFLDVPSAGDAISIKSFSASGVNFMLLDAFVGDGSTTTFESNSRPSYQPDNTPAQFYVTVDGIPTVDYTTATEFGSVIFEFDEPPASGVSVQISSFNYSSALGRAHAEIRSEQLVYDGTTRRFELSYPAGAVEPYASLTMLEVDGKVLRGADNTYYSGDDSTLEFSYKTFVGGVIDTGDAEPVYTTVVDSDKDGILDLETEINSFEVDKYDSVLYYSVLRDDVTGELSTARVSLVHNGVDAYVNTSFVCDTVAETGIYNPPISFDGDVVGDSVRLLGTGYSALNSMSYHRIGLGDNTPDEQLTNYTLTAVVENIDGDQFYEIDRIDKTVVNGVKYFISVRNQNSTQFTNTEALVVHNDSEAVITQFGTVNTNTLDEDLIELAVDIDNGDMVVRARATQDDVVVRIHRTVIDIEDARDGESIIGQTEISEEFVAIDTFSTNTYIGVHYTVVLEDLVTAERAISELSCITDKTIANISHSPCLTTNSVIPLTFATEVSGTTVTLFAKISDEYINEFETYGTVKVNGHRIGLQREPGAVASVTPDQIRVYINGERKIYKSDYEVNVSAGTVEFYQPPSGVDLIAISTLSGVQYYDDGGAVVIDPEEIVSSGIDLQENSVITATTFNNALGSKQRRELFVGNKAGVYTLFETPLNSDYVFVWINGESMIRGHDFSILDNIVTVHSRTSTSNDRVDIMYFAVENAVNATGFRIFKDMLNRTFYKRISATHNTVLASAIDRVSDTLTLSNGDALTPVDGTTDTPGVIFIGSERIEYFSKSGNTLSSLRRGTLGTAAQEHSAGAVVVDASQQQTLPYADSNYIKVYLADGSTTAYSAQYGIETQNELDVFVGGSRVSPEDYSIDGSSNTVVFAQAPQENIQVKIVQKKGVVWYTQGNGQASNGNGLQQSTSDVARFIAGEPTNVPE